MRNNRSLLNCRSLCILRLVTNELTHRNASFLQALLQVRFVLALLLVVRAQHGVTVEPLVAVQVIAGSALNRKRNELATDIFQHSSRAHAPMGGHVKIVRLLSFRRLHDLSLVELWLIVIQPRGGTTQRLSLHLLKI